ARADNAGGAAGAVLDDEVLADRLVELLHQDACDAVDRAAGRVGHDHGYRPCRIFLRRRRRGNSCDQGQREAECTNASHESSLSIAIGALSRLMSRIRASLVASLELLIPALR